MHALTVAQARAIDRHAVEVLGMPSILLMENAARGVAEAARRMGSRYVVLAGAGNNGGDGLAAARHLGSAARVCLAFEPDPAKSPDAALQLRILKAAGREILAELPVEELARPDVVWIDALFGTGLTRAIEGRAADWILCANAARGRRLAVDIPSGLCGDRGSPLGEACVRAERTVTFEAPKVGLLAAGAAGFVGAIEVVSLGLP
jgi:NAD(P)H-hydrate epimerase